MISETRFWELDNVTPLGELGMRASMSAARLEGKEYTAEACFSPAEEPWPGDKEGRILLGSTLVCRALGKEPAYMSEFLRKFPCKVNSRGYFGAELPENEYDEQQLSGHGWLLRGLVEYYAFSGNKQAYEYMKRVVKNLFLPLKGKMDTYPIEPGQRQIAGKESGEIADYINGWHLSTDIGCVFIPLDGLTAAYELLKDDELADDLKELIEEMIKRFILIDLIAIKAQTHATLTCSRGIMRMYELTGNEEYLNICIDRFQLYVDEGMTCDYQNYNWFGRPVWTEPCAVIDSFLLAMQLFRCTGDTAYIQMAQMIYYNGMGHEMRFNGGYGCDTCAGINEGSGDILKISQLDAHWCCSMRAGEGIARVVQYAYLLNEEERRVIIPYFTSSRFTVNLPDGSAVIEQETTYPTGGHVRFHVLSNTMERELNFRLFIPEWVSEVHAVMNDYDFDVTPDVSYDGWLEITITPETYVFGLDFDVPFRFENAIGNHNIKDKAMALCGNVILGLSYNRKERSYEDIKVDFSIIKPVANGNYEVLGDVSGEVSCEVSSEVLEPIRDLYKEINESNVWDRDTIIMWDVANDDFV